MSVATKLDNQIVQRVSKEVEISQKQVQNVIALVEDGNTVPFIARYRKEQTGALDEVQIRNILDSWNYLMNLEERKEEVLRLIEEQGKLTEELAAQIHQAKKLQQVEDLYRPFKQKRRTKATVAKEKGLEPLAQWLLSFPRSDVKNEAQAYINEEVGVQSSDEAIQGALDIVAEQISDEASYRQWIRTTTVKDGIIVTSVKDPEKDEKNIYEMYYEYTEAVKRIVPHRILAMNRGEKDGILKVNIDAPTDRILSYLHKQVIKKRDSSAESYIISAIEDAYKRLIEPSIEREIRKELSEKAEERAIHIFSENLRKLLLQPPLKGKVVLGVDPAFRTGCKLAVVDETGKVLKIDVIYPHPPVRKAAEAQNKLKRMFAEYPIEVVAIGNGTASRETEQFVADVLKEIENPVYYLIVNEAGASVYSASDVAREEFPDFQVEERSAVSIARRLQDPLAELVKIDPKSVGVGQYQHDVSQKQLNDSLTFIVETVVNQVGVNANTASASLLQYVAGLNKTVAQNIVKYRDENGKFSNRKQLKKIPRLGAKTYEQCIGFLRIIEGEEPLDRTGIHPETYGDVKKLLKKAEVKETELGTEKVKEALKHISLPEISEELSIGELTLKDIIEALVRPERDPRDELPKPLLRQDILKLEDLAKGIQLEGTVRNVVDFGAFIDIGVKQDGLVHISKLTNRYVKHPLDVVSVGDLVNVWVEDVDMKKGRVALTMIPPHQ
ncbi:RNA-binding transcriptional accessory protein [Priestia megaterium]|uniref:Tex family protein n=1 Tax=Priestia aryabhattai TaxID=412384 RepID=A0AAX6NI38_PRIAR|nr:MULTISPECIES: Tex family protein [Priestia]MDU9695568.1 Tex family protein [Priestia aryabhattai]PVC70323.1 RNA-binding transcriptional accessory protein [Priestia megaterium]QDZ82500.1 RNA-binding transcriptional accessory protein [Priestia megaterium]TPF14346.1 RNA-binding transcriptional accessory protein [Priestia megaterium]TPF19698.1 RNA-binding transcriptional accessory protein [Priestia megaterium]